MNWRDGHFHLNGTAECVFDCHIECIDQPGHLNGSASGLVDPAKHWLPLRHLLLSHEEMISEIRRSFHPILRESESPIFEVIAEFGRIAAYPEGDNPEFYYEFKGVAVEKRVYDIFSGGQDTPVIETYFLWDSPALRQNLAMRSTKTHPALNVPAQDKKSNDRKPSLGRNVEEVLREHPNLMNATNEAAQRDIERQLRAKGLITNGQSISKSTLLRAKKAVKSLK